MKSLFNAARGLLSDMASTIFFLILMAVTKNVVVAVVAGMLLGIAQMGWQLARKQKIDLMQAMSLFLVIASGAATLITRDPRFVMVKPSLIYLAVGVVMLRPGWLNRYLPPVAVGLVPDLANLFGFVWAGLMFVSAGVNLYAGLHMSPLAWAGFMSAWGIASKCVMFAVTYLTLRLVGRRRYFAKAATATREGEAALAA
jgi:intracellular septation protein A